MELNAEVQWEIQDYMTNKKLTGGDEPPSAERVIRFMRYKNNIEILNNVFQKIKDAGTMKDQKEKTDFIVMVLMNLGAHQNIYDEQYYRKKELTKEEHEKLSANIDFLKNQCVKLLNQRNFLKQQLQTVV